MKIHNILLSLIEKDVLTDIQKKMLINLGHDRFHCSYPLAEILCFSSAIIWNQFREFIQYSVRDPAIFIDSKLRSQFEVYELSNRKSLSASWISNGTPNICSFVMILWHKIIASFLKTSVSAMINTKIVSNHLFDMEITNEFEKVNKFESGKFRFIIPIWLCCLLIYLWFRIFEW